MSDSNELNGGQIIIDYLIKEKVIDIEPIKQDSIPEWLKMNGQKWLEGDITQKEYFDVIKFVSSE